MKALVHCPKTITLNLPYSIGDIILVDNLPRKIIAMHLYVCTKGLLTARYYCGSACFLSFPLCSSD